MRWCLAVLFLLFATAAALANELHPGRVELLCHRTANEDVPENTLESLEQAALLGCNVVEIDLRRTLDGKIVLNHDGILEHLSDGVGEVEKSYYGDLQMRDFGAWMGERFTGMYIALFEDALRMAREKDIRLILDIKTKGIGEDVLRILEREGMLQRVRFNGEWDDVKRLYPGANAGEPAVWVQPGVTAAQVKEYHAQGKAVIANFSANTHGMDLAGMKAAVAAGVDGINVDYPRLGADAVGRPVEKTLAALVAKASTGESSKRSEAILELSRYSGFPLTDEFAHWLCDADDRVSRAAAVALASARPRTPVAAFQPALRSKNADARANAAWALGMLHAPASVLTPLLQDGDPQVLQQALMALSRGLGTVGSEQMLPLLSHADPAVRGAAALALAYHQPELALKPVSDRLQVEIKAESVLHDDYVKRGKPPFTQAQIATIMASFRCQMKMVQALAMLQGADATAELEELAFRAGDDFSQLDSVVAAFNLWDRLGIGTGGDAAPAVKALGSHDTGVADRAEWMLVKAGPAVLPTVREALTSTDVSVRERAIRIVAWQGDRGSVDALQTIVKSRSEQTPLARWAIEKIEMLHPER